MRTPWVMAPASESALVLALVLYQALELVLELVSYQAPELELASDQDLEQVSELALVRVWAQRWDLKQAAA